MKDTSLSKLTLKELIVQYENHLKEYPKSKKILEEVEFKHSELSQHGLQLSKAILEKIGMDTDNFRGGMYNFPDEILPFLKKVTKS